MINAITLFLPLGLDLSTQNLTKIHIIHSASIMWHFCCCECDISCICHQQHNKSSLQHFTINHLNFVCIKATETRWKNVERCRDIFFLKKSRLNTFVVKFCKKKLFESVSINWLDSLKVYNSNTCIIKCSEESTKHRRNNATT